MSAIRWLRGAPEVRSAVERWLAGGPGHEVRDGPRRRLVRLDDAAAGALMVKQFRAASGRHPWRERAKRWIGRGQAEREERILRALRGADLAVAEPLAFGLLADGDALLVLRFLEGRPLEEVLAGPAPRRRALLSQLGAGVAALHRAGFVHGDLHHGNVWVTEAGPVLLDLQHGRRSRARAARLADLGQLDYAFWDRIGLADRLRLRTAALGLARPFDEAARAALRAVGRAAEARAAAHARGRTRRALRPGAAQRRARSGALRGLRLCEVAPADLDALVAAHAEAQAVGDARVRKADDRTRLSALALGARRVFVKETRLRGLARGLADAWRGSAGRRAWRAGHGLRARGVGVALPLAYLEERRLGVPVRSLVVLEDLGPAPDALEAAATAPEAAALALGRLAARLHRRGVDHGDLKCTNVHLEGAPPFRAHLVDLEGVRFRRRLSDPIRIEALAQLNASLPEAVSAAARRRAFVRYRAEIPFAGDPRVALREVVSRSLARRHRWSGAGCSLAAATLAPSSDRPGPR
jgi:tRNA A-37 threonylcarbamoyl transferase component Bud32